MFKRSVQSVTNAFKKVQERAIKSTQNRREETEEEKSIKALFADRIVKGRPDLFTPSSPIPSPRSPEEPEEVKKDATTPRLNILQANLSGFVFPSHRTLISSLVSLPSNSRRIISHKVSGESVFVTLTSDLVVRMPNTFATL